MNFISHYKLRFRSVYGQCTDALKSPKWSPHPPLAQSMTSDLESEAEVWFLPSLASGVCTWRGREGVLPMQVGLWGGGEAHTTGFMVTCFWEEGHKVQMVPMHYQHGQGRRPLNLLPIVSGPWTSFVDALDKDQWKIAVCRRHNDQNDKKIQFLI